MPTLTFEEKNKRAAILCCHFARNYAYATALLTAGVSKYSPEFWRGTQANAMDICVLEWCKLFDDKKGKHSWKKVIINPDVFFANLLTALEINEEIYDSHKEKIKDYRDKFVAHLDNDYTMHIPMLNIAYKAVKFYYDNIPHECKPDFVKNNINWYFEYCRKETIKVYKNSISTPTSLIA